MAALFTEGFLLGLSTGFYCLVSCLPLLLPYVLAEGRSSWKTNGFILLQFLIGRFAAYMLFAALATWAGKAGQYEMPGWVLPASLCACGVLMMFLAIARVRGLEAPCLLKKDLGPLFKRLPVALGFATGINICPPFAAGLLRLMGLADFARGTVYFCGFYAATSLFMSPVLLGTPWISNRVREIGRLTLLLAGLWYCGLGLAGLLR
ncbi:MAG: sulfite exporter TauE/SafE family protein [Elusimicrobia bacterium]|nr:sulfite exporter TauE/SafE family protein [Elusimicrobiota bacterium]